MKRILLGRRYASSSVAPLFASLFEFLGARCHFVGLRSLKWALVLVLGVLASGCKKDDCGKGGCAGGKGAIGEDCYSNRTCDAGARCDDGVCIACELGDSGCACLEDGSCSGALVCQGAICDSELERTIPEDPQCFTPCRESFTSDEGEYRECEADGLMRGCIGGATCERGTCVQKEAEAAGCASDVECPDFQVCIQGRCYADCEYDSDCPTSARCYRHSCRLPCGSDADTCGEGTYCAIADGDRGYCMPLSEPEDAASVAVVPGTFALSSSSLALSNLRESELVDLRHDAPYAIEFTLRKLSHQTFGSDAEGVEGKDSLPWLSLGTAGDVSSDAEVSLVVDPEGEAEGPTELEFRVADDAPDRWEGVVEVESPDLGTQRISLTYAAKPDGRWAGKQYYFGQFGDQGIEAWRLDPTNESNQQKVKNAFIRKWAGLRSLMGGSSGKTDVALFQAVLQSTLTESWKWPSMQDACPVAACLPYENAQGYVQYVDDLDDAPIPTGAIELPVALDLRVKGAALEGRIVSEESLHYAGDPAIRVLFEKSPAKCTQAGDDCLLFTAPDAESQVNARVLLGGRYRAEPSDVGCGRAGDGLTLGKTPSLIPGFRAGTDLDAATGLSYFHECRDAAFPYSGNDASSNLSLAQANPVPDGRRRVRALEILDGMMVSGDSLYLIFKEYFEGAALGLSETKELPAYGIMVLNKTNANLSSKDFEGTTPKAVPTEAIPLTELTTCSAELMQSALGTSSLTSGNASDFVDTLLDGVSPDVAPDVLANANVHYLCHDTGFFDQGSGDLQEPESCPAGSGVTFFTGDVPTNLAGLSCQDDGDCQSVLDNWARDPGRDLHLNPVWRCAEENAVYCDKNRIDLRSGKVFFQPLQEQVLFPPLQMEIESAFRYRTQFQNRQGAGLGFAPAVCEPGSSIIPYCYDPAGIERVRERVDCLTWVFTQKGHLLDEAAYDRAREYLTVNFSSDEEYDPFLSAPIVHDGFEFLNAQLLITLGDESFARAFQSRFDLAGAARASFEGSQFEPGGLDLSGVAGFEMYTLHQAVQYYQTVLDRFFSLAGYLREDVQEAVTAVPPKLPVFVTQEAVTSYIDRTLRASAQKTRAYSEIAKRYQSFQRPDLARQVVERAYTGAYLESMLVTRLMVEISDALVASDQAQVRAAIDRTQRVFRAAMLEMRELYSSLNDQLNAYGYAPDYIPFPELQPNGPNAFQVLMSSALQKLETARSHEENALSESRTFSTSQEEFQRELAGIRTNYENQLAGLCGTFVGQDGNVYPAIEKYAYLNERARLFGDPCGLMGNGAIHEAIVGLESTQLDVMGIQNTYDDLKARIDLEEARITAHCETIESIADYEYEVSGKTRGLNEDIERAEYAIRTMERTLAQKAELLKLTKCTVGLSTDCGAVPALIAQWAALTAKATGLNSLEPIILQTRSEIAEIERNAARWNSDKQCELARIDSDALVKGYLLDLKNIDLDALRTDYRIRLALSEIDKLRNDAKRLYAEQQDTEQLSINVEAARNDPNVRIYKNDAILNADRSFHAALSAAYKATKAFEYYTSQSYARLDTLALVRLVARGDYSLETYLRELEDDYSSFGESFGQPDVRVDVLSLRDDVLSIPRHAEDGTPLSEGERVRRFREVLTSRDLLDVNGHLSVPFGTNLTRLSPATVNHKIHYVEAEIIGSDVGDTLGRLCLRQSGTGVLRSTDGAKTYYRFPERMAVIDPFFNGVRAYGPEIYRNDRLRDRPFVNTHWELLLNQVDEQHNQDINLNALTDIRLLVFYTDFTAL